MNITATSIKLAVFSVVLLLLTAAIVIVFGQVRFDRTVGYSAVFSNASGLRAGQFVRASGVEVGKVAAVTHIDRNQHALVEFRVDRTLPLYESSTAQIRYADLIGNRYLELQRGTGDVKLAAGASIPLERTRPALDLDALIGGFQPLFRALDPDKINSIASSIVAAFQGQGGTIADVLDQTAQLTATLADRDRTVGQVVENLNSVLDTTVAHQQDFDQLVEDIHTLVTGLSERSDPLSDATAHISNAAGTLADLLAERRPLVKDTVGRLETVQQPLIEDSDQLGDLLGKLPGAFQSLGRVAGVYGSFVNFYMCDLTVRMNGAQPGGPVRDIKLIGQPSGRCTPQ